MAKELQADLRISKISGLLEYTIQVDKLKHSLAGISGGTTTDINTINTKGSCNNFVYKRLLPMLRELAANNKFYKIQKITTSDGLNLDYITILHNTKTIFLFETFKKLGISLTTLEVGIDWVNNKLYLNNSLYKDLSRIYGNDKFEALVMYIVSLIYAIKKICILGDKLFLSKNDYDDTLHTNFNADQLNDLIYSFDKDQSYFVTALDLHEFKAIGIYYDNRANLNYNNRLFKLGTYTCLKIKNGSEESYGILYNAGFVKDVSSAFLYTVDDIYTNQLMDLPALSETSIEQILALRTINKNIIYENDFLQKNEYEILSSEDFIESINSDETAQLFTYVLDLFTTSEVEENLNSKKILELFPTMKISVSKTGLDIDSIKDEYKDDEYAQELYKQILPYYEDFDLKELTPTVKAFIKGDITTAIFYGSSGTGKSTAAKVIASRTGIPFVTINCSTNIEESDLFGTLIPNPNKKTADDPEHIWQDGIITKALRGNGYIVVIEEGNFARPGILGKLNSLLDENHQIELLTGEIVKAPKNFRLFFTCNIGYEGTNRLNPAFINRFELVKEFENPKRKEIIDIITSRTGYSNKSNMDTILNVYEAIKKYGYDNNLDLVVSIRQLLTLFKAGKYFKTAYDAIMNIVINNAFINDSDYKLDFMKTVLKSFNLTFKI